jgi:hypothetical protein
MTRYVFMPDDGADRLAVAHLATALAAPEQQVFFAASAASAPSAGRRRGKPPVRIIDVFEPTGIALVEASARAAVTAAAPPGGTYYPVLNYQTAIAAPRAGRTKLPRTLGPAGGALFALQLRLSASGAPISGAVVHLRLKGSAIQLSASSDAQGNAVFGLRAPGVRGAMLLVEPGFQQHWGYMDAAADLDSGDVVTLDAIDLPLAPDVLRKALTPGRPGDGAGVRIGVIDTGVGPHRDLPQAIGDHDTSDGHGTHVAGIIGGRGAASNAGIAPDAEIRSYRVFPDRTTGLAPNYEIHKAIERAASDGCHLINLSLKSERLQDPHHDDKVISRAIRDAADRGVLAIAAAGNDFRRFVSFPARHPDVLSVSAFGDEAALPPRAYDRWTVSQDRAKGKTDVFFANFSNQGIDGTKVDLTAPGAGVVSTVPGDGYAPMSGTSMACPAATGAIARVLSRQPAILAMPPDRTRMQAMRAAAIAALASVGFAVAFEGQGMVS